MTRIKLYLLTFMLTIPITAAQSIHTHGEAQLNIVIEKASVQLVFNAPGMSIVGFEHAASSKQDKLAIKHAKDTLKNVTNFRFSERSGVFKRIKNIPAEILNTTIELVSHNDNKPTKKNHAHDDHHEHEEHNNHDDHHNHSEKQATHYEFLLKSNYKLPNNTAIATFSTTLFEQFNGIKKITVNIIQNEQQNQYILTKETPYLTIEN
ncbi:MAG: ZrgA family zinc uptake protein [Candidatus Marinamargulisbacteria bacterium]